MTTVLGGSPPSPSQPTPLRGMLRTKSRMEMLQDAYLRAVASAAGCTMAKPEPDDGIDWILTHSSTSHTVDSEIELKVQLKSTSQARANPRSGSVSVPVENERFKKLARTPVLVNRILVAMVIPKDVNQWLAVNHNVMEMRHCCYWINMAGMVPNPATEKTQVRVPTQNIFDDVALCDIMQRIGVGQKP